MTFVSVLMAILGGALGSAARYIVSVLAGPISTHLPLGTLIINVTGSFLIGFFGTLTIAHGRFPGF
jgi:CrcB protein